MSSNIRYNINYYPSCCGAMIIHKLERKLDHLGRLRPIRKKDFIELDKELHEESRVENRRRVELIAAVPNKIKNAGQAAGHGKELNILNLLKYCEGWRKTNQFVNKKSGNTLVTLYKDFDI